MSVIPKVCKTCEWWAPLNYNPDDVDDDGCKISEPGVAAEAPRRDYQSPVEKGMWGHCRLIGDPSQWNPSNASDRDLKSDKAFTRDASDYWSALLTRSDFGCVEWAND